MTALPFEFWILLHFEYAARSYNKSADVIPDLRSKHGYSYEKESTECYKSQEIAIQNARRLRQDSDKTTDKLLYGRNPHTNMDELIKAVKDLISALTTVPSPYHRKTTQGRYSRRVIGSLFCVLLELNFISCLIYH